MFEAFPKIPRLNRGIVISEKLDGTNAQVHITRGMEGGIDADDIGYTLHPIAQVDGWNVYAGSRSRYVFPGKDTDNFGFAAWVQENAESLVAVLGEGRHYGEWWGAGIQRGYGRNAKQFSLFNAERWKHALFSNIGDLRIVPVLYSGEFCEDSIHEAVADLALNGSYAAPGYMNPEGVVIYHTASRTQFKVTLDRDGQPKGVGR